MITNFQEYYKLSEYYNKYTDKKIVLTMGVDNLIQVFEDKYYKDLNGGILEAFGNLFSQNVTVLLYPMLKKDKLIDSKNLVVNNKMKNLYKFFKDNKKIIDIKDYNIKLLKIFSWKVLENIKKDKKDWEKDIPKNVSDLIKKKKLFGYS